MLLGHCLRGWSWLDRTVATHVDSKACCQYHIQIWVYFNHKWCQAQSGKGQIGSSLMHLHCPGTIRETSKVLFVGISNWPEGRGNQSKPGRISRPGPRAQPSPSRGFWKEATKGGRTGAEGRPARWSSRPVAGGEAGCAGWEERRIWPSL